jgi:phenylacetate-CoA ligase
VWDREVGAVMFARQMFMQGVRPGDIVLNSWSYGLHNGAHSYDESLYRWLNCVVLTTSTGTVTSSERQVELAIAYGASSIMTTGDYLLRLEEVAEWMGTRLPLRAIPNIGDRKVLEEKFGLEYFDSYGFHEVQTVAVECPVHDGLHIFEDAYIIQIVDPETGEPLPDGEMGAICVTELYKTGSSQFRYNIMDLSYLYPPGQCACGSWLRRMGPFSGRGDNMVKLRGVNVWPEAVGDIAHEVEGATTDYFVRAVREGNRDELIVSVVSDAAPSQFDAVREAIEERLHARLGLRIRADVVAPGAIDEWTEIHTSPKPKRFRDER